VVSVRNSFLPGGRTFYRLSRSAYLLSPEDGALTMNGNKLFDVLQVVTCIEHDKFGAIRGSPVGVSVTM